MLAEALERIGLYCTSCRQADDRIVQHRLTCLPDKTEGSYIISGSLECPNCGTLYPITNGVPRFFEGMASPEIQLNQYLDSHYGGTNESYWDQIPITAPHNGVHLDAGCGVGRNTFESARHTAFAVGLDANAGYLEAAAAIQRKGRANYRKKHRAMADTEVESKFVPPENVIFVLADIHNPPFLMETFDSVSALNVIDSVAQPLLALGQMDAALKAGGRLLLSSPYTWTESISKGWLETPEQTPHAFVLDLLTGSALPWCGFRYRILSEKSGIEWRIQAQDTMAYVYSVDLIEAEKI
ncbi:methyltransferase domain-containing protein [Dehalogenimonas sp. 4OHTPN]|uniref:Methyltransferase domain-containing protein n=1 Tax=Dehalogenimonas sp. 4OHTPN TaxID=3166643 RepID=A0AAU8GAY5_9CHLR